MRTAARSTRTSIRPCASARGATTARPSSCSVWPIDPITILAGAQSDFSRHLAREGAGVEQLVGAIIDDVLERAGLDASAIEAIHVGNAFGELFTGQAQLGAMLATVREALWGIPASRHEAACASGSVAVLSAMADLEAPASPRAPG